jgi:hypothetical protein
MKIFRSISIAVYAMLALLGGGLLWQFLSTGGGGRTRGHRFGNLWISFATHDRGVLSERIDWFIATPEMPVHQEYNGAQWIFQYGNGNEFRFAPDSKKLIWVDPNRGPTTTTIDLTTDLIARTESSQERAKGQQFNRPEEFLGALTKSHEAEQAVPSDGHKPSSSVPTADSTAPTDAH